MTLAVIACQTIEDEVLAANAATKSLPIHWVESGLHTFPDKLRERLQEEINRLEQLPEVTDILLVFGCCGNSLVGLSSKRCNLIIPKVQDCISLLLGGDAERIEVSARQNAYFLTSGWLRYENNIYREYEHSLKKYGPERTARIMKAMLRHYSNLSFIETGTYDLQAEMEQTKEFAEILGLQQTTVPGTLRYIERALAGDWDEGFIRVAPGQSVQQLDFGMGGIPLQP